MSGENTQPNRQVNLSAPTHVGITAPQGPALRPRPHRSWFGRMLDKVNGVWTLTRGAVRGTVRPYPILNATLVTELIGVAPDARQLQLFSYALSGQRATTWPELIQACSTAANQRFNREACLERATLDHQAAEGRFRPSLLSAGTSVEGSQHDRLGDIALALFNSVCQSQESGAGEQRPTLRADVSVENANFRIALMSIFVGYAAILEQFRNTTSQDEIIKAGTDRLISGNTFMGRLHEMENTVLLPIIKPAFEAWLKQLGMSVTLIDEIFTPNRDAVNGKIIISAQLSAELNKYPRAKHLFETLKNNYTDSDTPFLGWLLRLSVFLIIFSPEQLQADKPLLIQSLANLSAENMPILNDLLRRVQCLFDMVTRQMSYQERFFDGYYPRGLFGNDEEMVRLLAAIDTDGQIALVLGKSRHLLVFFNEILKHYQSFLSNTRSTPFANQIAHAIPNLIDELIQLTRRSEAEWRQFCQDRGFPINEEITPLSIYHWLLKELPASETRRKTLDAIKPTISGLHSSYQAFLPWVREFVAGAFVRDPSLGVIEIVRAIAREYIKKNPGTVSSTLIESYLTVNADTSGEDRNRQASAQIHAALQTIMENPISSPEQRAFAQAAQLIFSNTNRSPITQREAQSLADAYVGNRDQVLWIQLAQQGIDSRNQIQSVNRRQLFQEQLQFMQACEAQDPLYTKLSRAIQRMDQYFDHPKNGRRNETTTSRGSFYSREDCDKRMESWYRVLHQMEVFLQQTPEAMKRGLPGLLAWIDEEIYRFKGFYIPMDQPIRWLDRKAWHWETGENWQIIKDRYRALVKSVRRFTCLSSRYASHLKSIRSALAILVRREIGEPVPPRIEWFNLTAWLNGQNIQILYHQGKALLEGFRSIFRKKNHAIEMPVVEPKEAIAGSDMPVIEPEEAMAGSDIPDDGNKEEQQTAARNRKQFADVLGMLKEFFATIHAPLQPHDGNQLLSDVLYSQAQGEPMGIPYEGAQDREHMHLDALQATANNQNFLHYWHLATGETVKVFDQIRLEHNTHKPR